MRTAVWFWGTGGAGSRVTIRIADRLAETFGAAATALLLHRENPFRKAAEAAGHPVFTIGGAAGHGAKAALLLAAPWRALRLLGELLRHRPSLVVIPMNFALACPLALVPRVLGIPIVYVAHDAEPHPGDFAPGWQRATQRWLIGRAARIVAMSEPVALGLRTLHPGLLAERIEVLPLHALARTARRGARPAPIGGPLRFLFVGRLIHYKGLDLLAQALVTLKSRTDWRLTIAGDGPERALVKSWFESMGQVDLTRLRWLDDSEIEDLIDEHDVMLCPYREASQSGSIVEALYNGMPSLVTPVGGLPAQIGNGEAGWIAASATPAAIADAIALCLDQRRDYAAISAATAAFAEAELAYNAWPKIAADALKLGEGR